MADPALSIVHESETQRQFVRLKMPCTVAINGQRYPVKDLSSGGLALRNVDMPLKQGQRLDMILTLPFHQFSLDVALCAEVQHVDKKIQMAGCRFIDLDATQISILNHIVRAYMAGDVVEGGDILNIASRNNFVQVRPHKNAAPEKTGIRVKTYAVYGLLALLTIAMAHFIVTNITRQVFILQSPYGVIEAPHYDLAAPISGIFHSSLPAELSAVEQGALIGTINPAAGSPAQNVKVLSPCDCFITARDALGGQYIAQGAPLISLTPSRPETTIAALFPARSIHTLRIGAPARMTISGNGDIVQGVVSDIRASDRLLQDLADTPAPATLVRITPDTAIRSDLIGRPVLVEIHYR